MMNFWTCSNDVSGPQAQSQANEFREDGCATPESMYYSRTLATSSEVQLIIQHCDRRRPKTIQRFLFDHLSNHPSTPSTCSATAPDPTETLPSKYSSIDLPRITK
ncbi:hypothetical protein E4T56_gene18878 [Termitomyces sp. T112]|nr:hypothetical protein E4T56_gene18878 [Termitomyces sp. T112]